MPKLRDVTRTAVAPAAGSAATRIEKDPMGPLDVPADAYYGIQTARAVVVYESSKTMGVGAEIGAMIAEEGFSFLDAPVRRVSPPDAPQEPFAPTLAEAYLPDANRIAQAIRETVAY